MTPAVHLSDRRQLLTGAALGVYGAAIALAPSFTLKLLLVAPIGILPVLWPLISIPNCWLAGFCAVALLAPPLPIAIGDTGPHPALLFAGAGLFAGFVRLSEWRLRADPPAFAVLFFALILLASIPMAAVYSGLAVAAASLARVALFGISVFVFLYVRDGPGRMTDARSFRALRWLFWAAALSALFACVDFYFQFPAPAGYEPQFVWMSSGVFRRAQGVFYEASTLGNLCAFFLEMIAVALFRPRDEQPVSRWAMFAGGAALAAALVLSYSRGSLINLAVALVVLFWLQRSRIRWRSLLAGLTIFGIGAAAVLAIAFPRFTGFYWVRISTAFQFFFESPNAVLSGRLASWELLSRFVMEHPWHMLLGVGYKTLPYSDFIGTKAVGDNTYLTLLVETGVLGLITVLALNAVILTTAYRAFRSGNSLRSFCGAWMFCFWAGQSVQMLSADLLTYWRVLPVYFFVFALAARE